MAEGLTQEGLQEAVRAALGTPPAVARERLGAFLRGEEHVLELRYDWPLRWVNLVPLLDHPQVAVSDGQEWLKIWLEDADNEG